MSVLVVGIGHPFRRDDAVGLVVADQVAALDLPGVTVLRHHGEGTDLMERWRGFDRLVLVDATCGGSPPGLVRHWDDAAAVPAGLFPKGSHVLGVAEALALARALDRLPAALRIVGVEGVDFQAGEGLHPLVMGGVSNALSLIVDFISGGASIHSV